MSFMPSKDVIPLGLVFVYPSPTPYPPDSETLSHWSQCPSEAGPSQF